MKKIKIIGIVIGIILIVVAALLTTAGISRKSDSYKNEIALMPSAEDSFSIGASGMDPRGMSRQSMENLETDSVQTMSEADRRVIKNGNLTMKVERVSEAQEKISEIARNSGGDVFSSNINQSKNNIKSGTIVVKVPVGNFEKAFSEIKNVSALIVRESTTSADVTEEYQDLETQIKNKKAEEQSYVRILDQAQKIDDILAVTRQISLARSQVERLEGRRKMLDSQTDMSIISVSLSEDQDITVVDSWRPFQIAKEAVNSLVKLVQGFISFLIVFVITLIPTVFLYALVIILVYLTGRKIYRKFKKTPKHRLGKKKGGYAYERE